MPIEDIVKNHELLAKVLSHYRYLLEHIHEAGDVTLSNAMKENLAFKSTIKQIEQVLALRGAKAREEAKKHAGLLTLAVSQYAKDLEAAFEKAKGLLPNMPEGDLSRLEEELKAIKAYLTQ
jgi:type VI protein secretion system component VasK